MNTALREQADPWAVQILDLEELHHDVTSAIVREVQDLALAARQGPPPATRPARLLLGVPGIGKTHLFMRLRRLVQSRKCRVTLVHTRPLLGAAQTPRLLLEQIFEQLRQTLGERPQIDLLVGAALALVGGQQHMYPNMYLEELRSLDPAERRQRLENGLESILEKNPGLDEQYLEILLQVPFLNEPRLRRTWLAWLEGRELDATQAERAGLPREPLSEARLLPALRTLAAVAAPASPLLLVFDQLENLVDHSEQEPRIKAYARLVMDLVDTVPGMVLIQMAVQADWVRSIEPHIDGAPRSRLSVDTARRSTLSLPTPAQCRALIDLWRDQLDPPVQPSPWPFSEAGLKALCEQPGITPRMLMLTFQEAVASGGETTEAVEEPSLSSFLDTAWEDHQSQARTRLQEADRDDKEVSADLLLDGLQALPGAPALRRFGHGVEAGGRRIELVQSSNARSAAAQLGRMKAPTLALRERWRPMPPSWRQTHKLVAELEQTGSRWGWLEREEAERLLALRSIRMALRSHDVTGPRGVPIDEAQAEPWLASLTTLQGWPLLDWLQGQERSQTPEPAPVETEVSAGEPSTGEQATSANKPTVDKAVPKKSSTRKKKTDQASTETTPPPVAVESKGPPVSPVEDRGQAPGTTPVVELPPVGEESDEAFVLRQMARLRVASIERLLSEANEARRPLRRASIEQTVKQSSGRLRAVGRSIVVWHGEEVTR